MRWFAHSGKEKDLSDGQLLRQHLIEVARIAAQAAGRFGAAEAGFLLGLLHDLGKYTAPFQKRLAGGMKVDHATAGAQALKALNLPNWDGIMAQILGYLIAGHHKGLEDDSQFRETLRKEIDEPDIVWKDEITLETTGLMPRLKQVKGNEGFQLAFLGRMLFSCLIDADRRDTAAFERLIKRLPEPKAWPYLPDVIDKLLGRFDAHMQGFKCEREIDQLRSGILEHVIEKAKQKPDLFTLTVPTGGGKTLASLGFALRHAKAHGLERIVYAIPFTSIIDQTVGIFEDVLGDNVVLAHHSGFDFETAAEETKFQKEEENRLRLAMQDWSAPIVVTTNLQLFESLFSHRPSQCRKLQSLTKSVIILDEAQTIPLHVLRPCLAALDELVRNYGCSVVLCTATQPAVLAPKFKGGLTIKPERELAPDPAGLQRALKRVTVRFADTMTDDDLVNALRMAPQALVIVNTRKHALSLYRAAKEAELDGLVHLTTRQYGVHRRRSLAGIRACLTTGCDCRVIATSLIEAGVDVDFPAVWRAEAGLDSIAQAAGRCNREGKRSPKESVVTVFNPAEDKPPREIEGYIGDRVRAAIDVTDPLSLASIESYFQEVYWRKDDELDAIRIANPGTGPRTRKILDKLTFGYSKGICNFDYRTVGESFRLISSGMLPVIVAFDPAAKAAITDLSKPDVNTSEIARRLQPFVVQVPPRARALLTDPKHGHAYFFEAKRFGDQFCILRTEKLYHEDVGLLWENSDYTTLEDFLF